LEDLDNSVADIPQSVADWSRAINLKPDLASAYYLRGDSYFREGDYESARADWERVLELEPGNIGALTNLDVLRSEGY
jgi:tetratricopeptide (TPR) repeat protein